MIAVAIFKKYLTVTFDQQFRYYLPTEESIRKSQVHSANADNQGHRLEKRFGHPALYADLFTPMVHAKMVHLLPQVYSGNIGQSSAQLDEYDGKKMEAQVLPGGIKIAGIEQQDLEYDPALYGRDRGEVEWDRRSSANLLDNAAHFAQSKMHIPVDRIQGYLHHGASSSLSNKGRPEQIELARLDSRSDAWPLLEPGGVTPGGYSNGTPHGELGIPYGNSQYGGSVSTHSLHQYPPSMPYERAVTPAQPRPMTPQGQQQPSPRSHTPGASVQPGQIFTPPQQQQSVQPGQLFTPPQQGSVQPGQIFAPARQPSAPVLQQPYPPGQHPRAATYSAPQSTFDARPAPGDYFNSPASASARAGPYASPVAESPARSPQPRGGTPQQGFTPRSQRQPSYDQLRQQPPGPGGPHGRYPSNQSGY